MPTFNGSRVDPQPHGRYKRFVGTLARILFGGVNAFMNHKKDSALQKGMKQLLTKQRVNEGKITALRTQMVSVKVKVLLLYSATQLDQMVSVALYNLTLAGNSPNLGVSHHLEVIRAGGQITSHAGLVPSVCAPYVASPNFTPW